MFSTYIKQHFEVTKTPFYAYDLTVIEENIRRFKSISYPSTSIHFASMANDNPELLRLLQCTGFGVFVNSLKHLVLSLDVGFGKDSIIFASTGVSDAVMKVLSQKEIFISLDSIPQIKRYGRFSPGTRAGLRLNIDEKSKNNIFIGNESRIGLMESEIDCAFAAAAEYGVTLVGPHVYLGTDVTGLDALIDGIDRTLELSDRFTNLELIDLGGGFPLDPTRFDFKKYNRAVSERMERVSKRRGHTVKLILEPGRSMFGDAGRFYAQITDIKERPDRWIVCVNASASLIPRAMFYEDYNPVSLACRSETKCLDKPADIVGSTTYSRDFLAKGISLPEVQIGDWLEFGESGSYCYSMTTRFLGQSLPPEYLATQDGLKLIRKGEAFLEEVA
ncbi:diaminopimelate decarboxylase family protein [Rhodomicrobium sp.]|uniref:diaminopimelate decarboxylase family protein n=1 Tax=Rhodomicrobium sp. TaxID=2720632 RepID=UPI0039E51166